MIKSTIKGSGSYLPSKVLTNDDIAKMVDTSDQWIFERTGITQRHIASNDQLTSDLAYEASIKAIESAGIDANELDLILLATSTPDQVFPSTAVKVQHMIGAKESAAFDLHAVCSGFVYGLTTANAFIKTGEYKKILVIGAETYSRIIDWSDRSTCILFGDGAGAFVLEGIHSSDDISGTGILESSIKSDGKYSDKLYCNGGPSSNSKGGQYIQMNGREVYKHAVEKQTSIVNSVLLSAGLTVDKIDWLVPHQANLRILEATAKRLDIPSEKIIITVEKHANTSSASIPIAMDSAINSGKIKRGDIVMLVSFGSGFTWGATVLRY
ncbi:MAG: beta-ketoacyl-ACP synthase III [Alphaproteobacteria bacterium]